MTQPPEQMPEPGQGATPPNPQAGMPKWLIYGFAIKMVLVVLITVGVMYWAGVFG